MIKSGFPSPLLNTAGNSGFAGWRSECLVPTVDKILSPFYREPKRWLASNCGPTAPLPQHAVTETEAWRHRGPVAAAAGNLA